MPFTVDAARHLLTRDGVEIPLDRACFEILLCLLDHAGEVVTKDELLETAWPGRVVGENSLNKAIGRVRAALDDDGQTLIRTVHGYGYRFADSVSFTATSTITADRHASADAPAVAIGDALADRVGWMLTHSLGRGSFGEVWAARNANGTEQRAIKFASGAAGLRALKREVALHKLMRVATGEMAPTVTLLGWNLTVPPFHVEMPVVANGNLRQWANRDGHLAALPLAQRLDLVIRLCEAVARIHALGIIHKDLKPENILVAMDEDGNPQPLLTDFGAGWVGGYGPAHPAFPLSTELADALRESPQVASALYVAPETLRRPAPSAPTSCVDVYALGVLLYQIVVADLQRPLSPGWEDEIDDPLLRSDIANAAAIDPAKRTDSTLTLADGLLWLDRRREDAGVRVQLAHTLAQAHERAQKARLRRRNLAALAGVFAIGMTATSWMYLRAEQAGEAARAEARRAEAMLEFMSNDVIDLGDPYGTGGKDVSLRDAIDNGAARIDHKFGDDVETALAMHHAICKVYAGVGEYVAAIKHCSTADQLAEQRNAEMAAGQATRLTLLNDLALTQVDADRIADAEKTLARLDAILGDEAPSHLRLRALATRVQLRYEQSHFREAIALADQLKAAASPTDHAFDDIRANALWYGALSRQEVADYARSRDDFIELIALRKLTYGPEHILTAWTYCNYGSLLTAMGLGTESEENLRKAIALFDKIVGSDNPDLTAPRHYLAQLYLMQERWADAAALLESILDVRRRKLPPDHGWIRSATVNLADAYLGSGRLDDAQKLLQLVRPPTGNQPLTAEEKASRSGFLITEAELFRRRDDFENALTNIVEAQSLVAEVNSQQSPYYAVLRCQHGRILQAMHHNDGAKKEFDACAKGLAASVSPDHPWRRQVLRWQTNEPALARSAL